MDSETEAGPAHGHLKPALGAERVGREAPSLALDAASGSPRLWLRWGL